MKNEELDCLSSNESADEVSAPLGWFPRLVAATPAQRAQWEIIGRGEGFHWEEIDEDISVASILGLPSD